jgi:hypothetical protein
VRLDNASEILPVTICLASIVFGSCNFRTAIFECNICTKLTTTGSTLGWSGVSLCGAYADELQ